MFQSVLIFLAKDRIADNNVIVTVTNLELSFKLLYSLHDLRLEIQQSPNLNVLVVLDAQSVLEQSQEEYYLFLKTFASVQSKAPDMKMIVIRPLSIGDLPDYIAYGDLVDAYLSLPLKAKEVSLLFERIQNT